MKAVYISEPGGPEVLEVREVPPPVPGTGEVLIDVVAAGLNRADVQQRRGHLPAAAGRLRDSRAGSLRPDRRVRTRRDQAVLRRGQGGGPAGRRRLRRAGGRAGGAGSEDPRRRGPGHRCVAARSCGHGLLQPGHDGAAAAGRDRADPRGHRRHRHHGHPAREGARRRGGHHGRHRGEGRHRQGLPGGGHRHQLRRGRLPREPARAERRQGRRRHPRRRRGQVPRRRTWMRWRTTGGWW